MAFLVHRAERADLLVEGLAELLREPPADPFGRELVIVPARGVERWLSQRLSHRLGPTSGHDDGVCAGIDFRSPSSLVADLIGARGEDAWSPDALVWPLLQVVDASAGEPWCRTLSEHLGHGKTGEELDLRQGRRYATARRLARLFGEYAVQRPSLLVDWEAGRDTDGFEGAPLDLDLHWQAELWRRLVAVVGEPTPVVRHAAVVERLHSSPESFDLPERISFFGHTRIPSSELALLEALAAHRDVHLWLPHPSPALWDALDVVAAGTVARTADLSHEQVRHPLLASLGRDLRELQRHLPAGDMVGSATRTDGSLLHHLQADIAANALPDVPRALDAEDRSISVHACHGPARQVEVLREVISGLLADDDTLQPRDILVMCPDIEAYAPLVSAAFGLGEVLPEGHPGQHVRVRLADRSLIQTNPLLGVAAQLLDLASGRAEATAVLDLLATDPVRRRFGFTEDNLERIAHWVRGAGIRWAFDAEHRSTYSLDSIVANTWEFGLDRILAGVAVSEDGGRWFGTTLPLDDVSSTDIDLAGRLAECLDRLGRAGEALSGAHPAEHWVDTLLAAIAGLTSVPRGDEWQSGQVQRELAAIRTAAGTETTLRLADVRALLDERFRGRPTRANFRTGSLTVCTMTPMRSVPHRVVALLGLDDGVFPRAGAVDGDDVLQRRPLTGERDPRSEDRQLMLDAIAAATERLVITYTGANESTGQRRPPSVPLKELLDVLDRTAEGAAEHVVRDEPLQPFDPSNFVGGKPFSFDAAALAGARAAAAARVAPELVRDVRLEPRAGDIELADLTAFLARPVQQFLRQRLEIALLDESEAESDAIPVELDSLQQWAVGDRVLTDLLAGRSPQDALDLEYRRGLVPPRLLGWKLAKGIVDKAKPLAEMASASAAGATSKSIDVNLDLGGGRRLIGSVADVFGTRVVRTGYSRLGPRQELEAWIAVLALEATAPGRGWSAGAIGRGGRDHPAARVAFSAPDDPLERLVELVGLYDRGLCGPLPLPLKTGYAWARRRVGGGDDWSCRRDAKNEWNPFKARFPGENDDAAHRFVFGANADLGALLTEPAPGEEYDGETTRLGALAMTLWAPALRSAVRR